MVATPTTLLSRLEGVYVRVARRERPVMARVLAWKQRGKAGDRRAAIAYNTLAVIHWKRRNPERFRRSEIFYNRLMAREPKALLIFQQTILPRVKAGDMKARRIYASLKAVHHRRKASVWTMGPGSPQIGYHPMPQQHRVGIEFSPQGGGMLFSPNQIQQLGLLIQAALASTLTPGVQPPYNFPWLPNFPIPQTPGGLPYPGGMVMLERGTMPEVQSSTPSESPFPSLRVPLTTPTSSISQSVSTSLSALRKPSSVSTYYTTRTKPLG